MQPGPASRTTSALQAAALGVAVVLAALLAWHPLEDLDIWFHLRAGHDLVAHGPLPPLNHYSFTEPRHPWLNHEWLFQVIAAATGPRTAPPALDAGHWNLLRVCLACALAFVLAAGDGGLRRLRGHGSDGQAAASLPVLLVALGLLWPRLLLRPELLSYLLLVPLVRWTEALARALARDGMAAARPRCLVDPRREAGRVVWLVWLWAQCHGFAGAAPVIVTVGLAAGLAGAGARRGAAARGAGLVVLATLVALMATPNGWQGLAFPLRALGQFHGGDADLRATIAELAPLLRSPDSLAGTIRLFLASLAAGGLLAVLAWRRIGALRLLLWGATAAAAFASQRALGPYAVAFALLGLAAGTPHLDAGAGGLRGGLARRARPLAAGTLLAAALVSGWWATRIVGDSFYLHEGVARRFGGGLATAQYPLAAAGALAGQPPARVFANLGATGLLLGTTRAELYIDGRTEAYSPALWREYGEIRRAGEHALALLDARQVDAVRLATPQGPFAALAGDLLASHRWQLAAADGAGLLWRRESLPPGPESAPRQEAAKRERLLAAARAQEQAAASPGLGRARAADALLAAAGLYRLAADPNGRRACLEQAVRLCPGHALAHHNLGNALVAEGRHDLALPQFRAAAAANPRLSGSRLNAGVCLMRLDRAQEAVGWFRAAARVDGRSPEAWANLAIGLNATGDRAGALAASERALSLSPADARLAGLRDSLRRGGPAQ